MTPSQLAVVNQLINDGTPQQKRILKHLIKGEDISSLEAMVMYGIAALPRRIADLKDKGIEFVTERKKDREGRFYVKYRLRG